MLELLSLFLVLPLLPQGGAPEGAPKFSSPTTITNAHAPFDPGAMKIYRGRADGAVSLIVEQHLAETRIFFVGGMAVECVTLLETEFLDGALAEVSFNYFAQADDGTVYSFGEVVNDYVDGEIVAHAGSWLVGGPTAGDDAPTTGTATEPTEFMPAAPELGQSWKPDDLFPIAVANATVMAQDLTVRVKAATYEDVLLVEETSEAPDIETERKWYAPGVGVVKASARGESLQLVASTLRVP